MRELYILFAPVFWSIRNDIIKVDLSFYRKSLFYVVASLVFMMLIAKLLGMGMMKLQGLSAEVFGVLLMKAYSLLFIIIFFIQIVNGFVITLGTYYQSKELEFLMSSPVSRTALFFARFFETHVRTSWMLVIFGIPLLASTGLLYHAHFLYYVLSIMFFIAFSTIPVNIGISAAIIVTSFFHAKKLRKILFSSGIIVAILLLTLLRLFRPERFANPELFASLTLFVGELKAPSFVLLPNRWLSDSIFHLLAKSEGGNTAIFVSLLFMTSYVSAVIAQIIFKRYHYKGWGLLQEGDMLKGKRLRGIWGHTSSHRILQLRVVRHFVSAFGIRCGVLILKDLLYQIRDVRKIHQVLIVISLITIYLFSIASLPLNWVGHTLELRHIISFFNLGLILIIIAALCARIVYPAVTEEGALLWIIRTSPVTPKTYIWGKLLFFFVPLFIVGQLLAIASSSLIGIEMPMVVLTVISTAIVSLSLTSMAIVFGVSDLKYTTGDSHKETKPGSTIQMIASAFLIFLTLALEIVPVFLYLLKETKRGALSAEARMLIAGAVFLLCLINFFVTFLSLRISVRKIEGLHL